MKVKKKAKTSKIKNIKQQLKPQPTNQLKRPLLVKCFKCSTSIEVKWNTGSGCYSKKNSWFYWTENKKNKNLYICDKDLVRLYREEKWEYRENITNLARRRVLRTYIYDQKIV